MKRTLSTTTVGEWMEVWIEGIYTPKGENYSTGSCIRWCELHPSDHYFACVEHASITDSYIVVFLFEDPKDAMMFKLWRF